MITKIEQSGVLPESATRSAAPVSAPLSRWRRIANPWVNLSLIALLALTLCVIFADVVAPASPTEMNLRARLSPPLALAQHPLGTDATGRDILSRILHGGQVSLVVGGAATIVGLVLGALLGIISGYLRGAFDSIVMYLVDVQLSLPFLLLAVAVSLVLGTSLAVLVGLAALATIPVVARVVRSVVLSLRERDYVLAAWALGASDLHVMRLHLLPNLVAPLLVLATLSVGRIILLESGLSFLGIGIQPPTPSWGNMINEGRQYLSTAWWLSTMPGLALILLTMAVGTLGDWLRDLMDVTIN